MVRSSQYWVKISRRIHVVRLAADKTSSNIRAHHVWPEACQKQLNKEKSSHGPSNFIGLEDMKFKKTITKCAEKVGIASGISQALWGPQPPAQGTLLQRIRHSQINICMHRWCSRIYEEAVGKNSVKRSWRSHCGKGIEFIKYVITILCTSLSPCLEQWKFQMPKMLWTKSRESWRNCLYDKWPK